MSTLLFAVKFSFNYFSVFLLTHFFYNFFFLLQSVAKLAQQNLTSLRDGSATVKWGFFTPSPWALNDLALKLGEGRLRAHVGRVVPFEGALGAYRDLGRGKTVLSML